MECKDLSFTERKDSTSSKESFWFLVTFLETPVKALHEKLDACNITTLAEVSLHQSPVFLITSFSNTSNASKF
jgi:hypothetical protein